jgi:thiol-disulfide isomerase/thioredoxin
MPMMPPNTPPHQRTRFLIGMIVVIAALMMMMMFGKNPVLGTAFGQDKLNTGHMAAFVYKPQPADLPALKFVDAKGQERSLREWQGKVVLLNLWATWCAPCRKEMPDLDKLQAELGSDTFEVVALGVDRGGVKAAEKFLEQVGNKTLALYVDPTAKMANELRVIGLPATLLIDRQGREIGRLLGPAEWASGDAKALIKSAMR